MTNEEIFETIQEIDQELEQLNIPDKKLNKQEERHRHNLDFRKDLLQKLLEARAEYKSHKEFELTMLYGAVTSIGEKYWYLIPFIKARCSFGL
jgi:hypothetical protein